MSLTLTSYPVTIANGVINNIFPGFMPLNVEFKREDIVLDSITQGANDKVLLTVTGDITASISIGKSVYFYSEGVTFTYDTSGIIVDLTFNGVETEITVNVDFIEISSGGYVNYLQDWLTEVQLVNVNNSNILEFSSTLADDGTPSGIVQIDVSLIVDLLSQEFKFLGGEVEEGRVKFKVKYRQSWKDNRDEAWILIDDTPLIVYYGTEELEPETFVNALTNDTSILYNGYISGISFLHSDSNYEGERLQAIFDELDINKDVITSDNLIRNFDVNDYGFLFISSADLPGFTFNPNTKYGRLKIQTTGVADFASPDFASPDFQTT